MYMVRIFVIVYRVLYFICISTIELFQHCSIFLWSVSIIAIIVSILIIGLLDKIFIECGFLQRVGHVACTVRFIESFCSKCSIFMDLSFFLKHLGMPMIFFSISYIRHWPVMTSLQMSSNSVSGIFISKAKCSFGMFPKIFRQFDAVGIITQLLYFNNEFLRSVCHNIVFKMFSHLLTWHTNHPT